MKRLNYKLITTLKTFLAASMLSTMVTSYADDTEAFYSVNVSKPNLLFVLDVSGSMNSFTPIPDATTNFRRSIRNGNDDYRSNNSNRRWTTLDLDANRTHYRFTRIDIPQGYEITDAYIQFEATRTQSGDAEFFVLAHAADDSPRFMGNFNYYYTDHWFPEDWTAGDRGEDQRVDVTGIVQDVIRRSGWQANNAITIMLVRKGSGAERQAATFEHPNRAPAELVVEYREGKTRVDAMKEALRAVLDQAPDNIKVGLMNYGQKSINDQVNNNSPENRRHHSVSGVAFPVSDINARARDIIPTAGDVYGLPSYPNVNITVREYVADVADSWDASSFTPIVDALYEAALYFRGEKIHYGQTLPVLNGAHPSTYDGSPVTTNVLNDGRDNASAPKYKTPIESSCQDNFIVLMTDGAPTYRYLDNYGYWYSDEGPFARIRGTTNGPQGALASAITSCEEAEGVGRQGNCGAEITNYLATHDNLPDRTGSFPQGQEGDQFIGTYTVGFAVNSETETYLKSLATIDDGNSNTHDDGYFSANNPEDLAAAFRNILADVASPRGTLASPGYSVNVKNGLEHEDDIYIPVFDRKNSSRWSGNLKKFKLENVGHKRHIRGKNHADATDELGNFTNQALDYWSESSTPDGRVIQKGGLANLIEPANRKIYSNLTGDTNVELWVGNDNKLDVTSNIANLTNSVLGLPSGSTQAQREILVNFMRGWENGDATAAVARKHMGDMLHSEPLVITYNKGSGPSATGKQQYIFAGTNEGYLHAFDTITGEEKFAFIPAELLSTIAEPQRLNAGGQVDHKYGVDGALTNWFKGGRDGVVNSGDRIILYFGLRRGGSSYYALDVTDIEEPKLLWTKSAADHPTMGQSWSIPYLAKVGNSSGNPVEAVIVSGGYDEDDDRDRTDGSGQVDDATTDVSANEGNDILIFNAVNGDLIWSMPSAMRAQITNSIPGGVRVLDTNKNGIIDRMYFADTGGNVWRLDLSERIGDSSAATPALTKLASLAGSGADSRKFYNEPDVAIMKLNGHSVYAVSVGSGFRAHPMDRVINDKFYILIDESPFKPLETSGANTFITITESSLANISISGGTVTQTNSITDVDKRGWKLDLPETGEKVLGTALAVDGNIIFTTLVPEVLASSSNGHIDQCAAPVTQSRLFAIDILSGGAGLDLDGDGTITDADIHTDAISTEILGKVQPVFDAPTLTPPGSDQDPTGRRQCSHPVGIRTGKKLTEATGYDACRLESVYWSDPAKDQ